MRGAEIIIGQKGYNRVANRARSWVRGPLRGADEEDSGRLIT